MCLNDILDAMVRLAAGQDYAPGRPGRPQPCAGDEFEQAICRYLPVTPAQVRAQAAYDAGAGGYTYLPYGVSYWAVLPEMVPEVTEVRENADGTLTLAVDVACLRRGTDRLFTHELTVQPGGDGTFCFLSNRIVWQDDAPYAAVSHAPFGLHGCTAVKAHGRRFTGAVHKPRCFWQSTGVSLCRISRCGAALSPAGVFRRAANAKCVPDPRPYAGDTYSSGCTGWPLMSTSKCKWLPKELPVVPT